MDDRRRPGFTLIELLVVVTIIVILIALLTPAMERAMYVAELAACGANMKTVATGATTYAMAHNRFYPDRQTLTQSTFPNELYNAWYKTEDRPLYRGFISTKVMMDPLCGKIDVDESATDADSYVSVPMNMYFGWQYRYGDGGLAGTGQNEQYDRADKGMKRMGDRFHWSGSTLYGTGSWSFDVIAGDADGYSRFFNNAGYSSTHPDAKAMLVLSTYQNEDVAGTKLVATSWGIAINDGMVDTHERGALDLNYAFTDGSVVRFGDVRTWSLDERMVSVPVTNTGPGAYDYYFNLPRR